MSERFLREEMLLGRAAMEQLQNSHVAVFGLGGVGSWCAEALARAGIGELTLIDQDIADESNINRQLCALYSTLEQPKAEILAQRLLDINPELHVYPMTIRYEATTREVFFQTQYDYIVDAIDLVTCKIDLIRTAREYNIPIISALGTGNKLDASQLQICDISKTEGCPLARVVRRELRRLDILHHPVVFSKEPALKPEQVETPPPGRRSIPGSVVWVPATAGMLLAQHVVLAITSTVSCVS